MRKVLFFSTLFLLLTACSTGIKIRISDNTDDYAIYRNGKLACLSSANCVIKGSVKDEIYLDARKNGIVYGSTVVRKMIKENVSERNKYEGLDWYEIEEKKKEEEKLFQAKIITNVVLFFVFPVFLFDVDFGEFPKEVVIPIEKPDSSVAEFPWEDPINEK